MSRRTSNRRPTVPATEVGHQWLALDTMVWDLWNAYSEEDRRAASPMKETPRGIPQPPKLSERVRDDGLSSSDSRACSPAWRDAFPIVQPPRRSATHSTSCQRPASAAARFVSVPRQSPCSNTRRPDSASSIARRRPRSAGSIGSARHIGFERTSGQEAFLCRDRALCDFWAQQLLEQQEMARFRQDVIKQTSAESRTKAQQYRARCLFPSTSLEKGKETCEIQFGEAPPSKTRLQCLSATIPPSARKKMLERLCANHQAKHIEELSRSGANPLNDELMLAS